MKRVIKHEGQLNLNGIVIPCYVLEDGTRVLSGRAMQDALKLVDDTQTNKQKSGARLSRLLNSKTLNPYLFDGKKEGHLEPLECYKGESKINGFEATVLVDICDSMLEARKHMNLNSRQKIIADQCEILMRALAKVGIIALVDEATGYQYDRERDELQKILKAYISEELLVWQKRFPDVFYKEIFRLNNWDYTVSDIKKRSGVIGRWTNKIIYEQLPKGVLDELKRKTPKNETGAYKAKLHQSLTNDIGNPNLQAQINSVIPLMQISDNWKQFLTNFNKMVDRRSGQIELKFEDLEYKPETKKVEKSPFNDTLGALLNVPKPDK